MTRHEYHALWDAIDRYASRREAAFADPFDVGVSLAHDDAVTELEEMLADLGVEVTV